LAQGLCFPNPRAGLPSRGSMAADGASRLSDRLDPNRPKWEDLRDSSAEDLLDSQDLPGPPLHSNSYIETPEPSFDLEDGGVSGRLQHATALEGQPVLLVPAALAVVPESVQAVPAGPEGAQQLTVESFPVKSPLSAGAPEFIPMFTPIAIPTEHVIEEETQEADDEDATLDPAAVAAPAASGPVRHRIRGKRRPPPTQTAERATGSSRQKRRRNDEESEETRDAGGEMPPASEEEWQRRISKRRAVVSNVKETPEYKAMADSRGAGEHSGSPAPTTPDPNDRTISKRRWESEVMQWRTAVRQWPAPEDAN